MNVLTKGRAGQKQLYVRHSPELNDASQRATQSSSLHSIERTISNRKCIDPIAKNYQMTKYIPGHDRLQAVSSLSDPGPFTEGLSHADLRFLSEMLQPHVKTFRAGHILVEAGAAPKYVHLILSGWAYRYKQIDDKRRQIISFVLPHDIAELNILPITMVDHSMACVGPVTAAEVPRKTFDLLFDGSRQAIADMFSKRAVLSASIQREAMLSLGRRTAPQRIAHLICDLYHRLRFQGKTVGNQFRMPLVQRDIADATGLSLVHVNKRIAELKKAGLIIISNKLLTVPDLETLEQVALFSPDYLNIHKSAFLRD